MADYQYVTKTGLIVPDAGDTLANVQGEYRAAFGQDLVVTSDTNQGVLIAGETTARTEVTSNNAAVANQINPNLAGGVFLDAICALSGLERAPATFGVIPSVTVTGRRQTIIPQGSQARDDSGVLWATVNNVQIGSTGSATVDFVCSVTGPINVAVGDLNRVVDNVLGWEGVNNTLAAVPGTDEQSDESLRLLRNNTLAKQGISTREAQISDLYLVPGVRSLAYRENVEDTTQIIDGISMVPHSVWACVYGGADVDIALSLLTNKTDGANWNGGVTVATRDPWSGQAYTVKFARPVERAILVRVTIGAGSSVADPETAIPADVVAYASGQVDGEAGFTVGTNVSPFELAGAINRADPGIFVKKVELAFATGTPVYVTTELVLALNEVATVTEGSVQVLTA